MIPILVLARQLNQYFLPGDYDRVAELYSEAGGALCIEAAMVKAGQSGNEGDVEQYDDGHTGAASGHGGGATVS